MKRILIGLIFAVSLAIGGSANAALPPVYSHVISSGGMTDPANGMGAPDGNVTTFESDSAWIEFGFPEESTSVVTLSVSFTGDTQSGYASYWYMDGGTITHQDDILFASSESTIEVELDHPEGVLFDRVRVFPGVHLYSLDAAWFIDPDSTDAGPVDPDPEPDPTPIDEPTDPDDDPEPDPEDPDAAPDEPIERTSPVLRLIKLADDGDAATQHDQAVYVIDPSDNTRRPFFNEMVFDTWFSDFDDVEVVSSEEMASYRLGRVVPVHHGTWLVKVQSTPDVYAIERGAVLRRIATEDIAIELWGPNWAQRVRDIPVTTFPHYTMGDPIETTIYPDDTIVQDEFLVTWHIRNGLRRQIQHDQLGWHGIRSTFVLPNSITSDLSLYGFGAMYDLADDFGWFDLTL